MNTRLTGGWTAVLLTTGLAIGLNTAVNAGDTGFDVPKQVVTFRDLNLRTAAGAEVLYRRIQAAAEKVCGGPFDPRSDHLWVRAARARPCIAQATERGVNEVNSPMLTSLHLARTGRSQTPMLAASRP